MFICNNFVDSEGSRTFNLQSFYFFIHLTQMLKIKLKESVYAPQVASLVVMHCVYELQSGGVEHCPLVPTTHAERQVVQSVAEGKATLQLAPVHDPVPAPDQVKESKPVLGFAVKVSAPVQFVVRETLVRLGRGFT